MHDRIPRYVDDDDDLPDEVRLPGQRPRSARYVGSVAWAWSPGGSRVDDLYVSLDTSRRFWLLWRVWTDPDCADSRVSAFMRRAGQSGEEAALELIPAAYRGEDLMYRSINGPWQVWQEGVLSTRALAALAAAIWPPTGQAARHAAPPAPDADGDESTPDDEDEDDEDDDATFERPRPGRFGAAFERGDDADDADDADDDDADLYGDDDVEGGDVPAFPRPVQLAIDTLVTAWSLGLPVAHSRAAVAGWFDESGGPQRHGRPLTGGALSPATLTGAFSAIRDAEVRVHFGLHDRVRVTDVHRLEFLEGAVLPRCIEDPDVSHFFLRVPIRASDGTRATLIADLHGDGVSGVAWTWSGPFESAGDFLAGLRSEGWILDLADFARLPLHDRLARAKGVA